MSASQPIAFIDLDGVCYDFVGALESSGVKVSRDSFHLGLPPEALAKLTRDATLYKGHPIQGTTESCERLHELGFKLVFVTARPNVLDVMQVTLEFVDRITPEAQTPEVIFSYPLGTKADIVHESATPGSIQIDDDPFQLALCGKVTAYLISQPWNAGIELPSIRKNLFIFRDLTAVANWFSSTRETSGP